MLGMLGAAPALVPSWDGLSAARQKHFLAEHWQKRPLLIRGFLSPQEVETLCPLTPAELVNLACDGEVCSRLVLETGGSQPWELRHGPFEPDVLELMQSGPACSLLVQQVEQLVPEVGRLRERFGFVPHWRTDDVMVSCAPPGGSVGAHLDNYDVFLLQGAGERRWSVEDTPRTNAPADEALREGPQVCPRGCPPPYQPPFTQLWGPRSWGAQGGREGVHSGSARQLPAVGLYAVRLRDWHPHVRQAWVITTAPYTRYVCWLSSCQPTSGC